MDVGDKNNRDLSQHSKEGFNHIEGNKYRANNGNDGENSDDSTNDSADHEDLSNQRS